MESEYKILEKLVCEGKDVHIVTHNIAENTFLVQLEPQLMLLVKDNRADFRPHYVLVELVETVHCKAHPLNLRVDTSVIGIAGKLSSLKLDYVHTKIYEDGLKAWHDMQKGKAIQLNKFLDYYKSLKK